MVYIFRFGRSRQTQWLPISWVFVRLIISGSSAFQSDALSQSHETNYQIIITTPLSLTRQQNVFFQSSRPDKWFVRLTSHNKMSSQTSTINNRFHFRQVPSAVQFAALSQPHRTKLSITTPQYQKIEFWLFSRTESNLFPYETVTINPTRGLNVNIPLE